MLIADKVTKASEAITMAISELVTLVIKRIVYIVQIYLLDSKVLLVGGRRVFCLHFGDDLEVELTLKSICLVTCC